MLAYFTAASGVTVNYSSSEGYEQQIVIDAEAGSPPDVAVLPQPGLIADLAAKGFIVPLGDATEQWLTDNYGAGASWADLGTYKGKDGDRAAVCLPLQGGREVAGLVHPRELRGCGLYSSRHDGRADGADGEDRRRRRHALVHRPGFGWRDRLAGDRLGRGHDAAHAAAGSLRPMGDQRAAVQQPAKWWARSKPSARSPRTTPMSPAALRRRLDRLPRQPEGSLLVAAAVLHAPPGLVHPVLLPRRHGTGHDADFFYFPAYAEQGSGQPGAGRRHAGLHHEGQPRRARLHRMPEDADRA